MLVNSEWRVPKWTTRTPAQELAPQS